MTFIRSFIAVDLPDEIRSHLQQIIQSLRNEIPQRTVRWVAVNNVHLTLMFLGDVPAVNLQQIRENLSSEIPLYSQCDIQIAGVGAFPSTRRPRVIWVGVEYDKALKDIWSGIQRRMNYLGFPRDSRPFAPHLTIGRINRIATHDDIQLISHEIQEKKSVQVGSAQISSVHLYQSELKMGGSVYTKLLSINLRSQKNLEVKSE